MGNNNQNVLQQKVQSLAKKLNVRITVVDKRGKVLGDSGTDPRSMENHSDRAEIIEAFQRGQGESDRFSDTLGYNMKYVALPAKYNDEVVDKYLDEFERLI